jgi:hypothetical protein
LAEWRDGGTKLPPATALFRTASILLAGEVLGHLRHLAQNLSLLALLFSS